MDIYLDNAATTRVCSAAAEAAMHAMTEAYGNPSSTHRVGRQARRLLEASRKQVADALGCAPAELVFTSGGTEADNWALLSGAELARRAGRHIISSQTEHDAIRRSLDVLERRGFTVTRLAPDATGAIPVGAVEAALQPDTALVSLMLVNNETGAVNDIAAVSRLLRRQKSAALLHTDAVQGFCKLPFSPKKLGADLVSISGHKIHAPKGVGALYIRQGLRLPPLLNGGGQEGGLRPGTEPLPAIAAFGAAAAEAKAQMAQYLPRMQQLRQHCADALCARLPGLVLIPGGAAHILSISLPGYRSEVLMNFLEARGISVSKSSACKKGGRSHVLEAMGLSAPVIDGALRIGLSRFTTQEELDALALALGEAAATLAHR